MSPKITGRNLLRPGGAANDQVNHLTLVGAHRAYQGALRQHAGSPPAGMEGAHAHHILYFKGIGREQQALVIEGQMVLRSVGIDPHLGPENLVWTPNRAGQHRVENLRPLVTQLRSVYEAGGSKADVASVLARHARFARGR